MKPRIFIILVAVVVLFIFGCGQEEVLSPALTQGDDGVVLAKKGNDDDKDEDEDKDKDKDKGTPFTADIDFSGCPQLGPGVPANVGTCVEVKPDGTQKFRGCEFRGPISGNLVGEALAVLKAKVDAAGNGRGEGSVTLDLCDEELGCGTFKGRFKGDFTLGLFEGKFKAKGKEDLKGMKMKGSVKEQGVAPGTSVFTLTGTIR